MPEIEAWRKQAACRGVPEEDLRAFMPWGVTEDKARPADVKRVKEKYCSTCPVRQECLEFGASTESLGVWGGYNITWNKSHQIHLLYKRNRKLTIDMIEEFFAKEGEEDVV